MKNIMLLVATLLISPLASSSCNFDLAVATDKYLIELEKASLYKFQAKPCKVLNETYLACSSEEKQRLDAILNMDEVLGNICQPHLPPPSDL